MKVVWTGKILLIAEIPLSDGLKTPIGSKAKKQKLEKQIFKIGWNWLE